MNYNASTIAKLDWDSLTKHIPGIETEKTNQLVSILREHHKRNPLDGTSTETLLAQDHPIHEPRSQESSSAVPTTVDNAYSPTKDGLQSPSKRTYSASLRTVLDTPGEKLLLLLVLPLLLLQLLCWWCCC
jgi:hypothetical protein